MDKFHFLKHEFVPLLRSIDEDTKPLFGKMNVQQMIEHMSYAFRNASGYILLPALNDEEVTLKMYNFMMSEKPFRDNTPNPNLPDEPEPPMHGNIEDALVELEQSILLFEEVFNEDPERRILNPFFGILNFEEWVHLLHKHASHHLRQFGVTIH